MTSVTQSPTRAQIIANYLAAREEYGRLAAEGAAGDDLLRGATRILDLREQYRGSVVARQVSRCPFTAAAVIWSVDDGGLDGPFWDYEAEVRPHDDLPPTVFAISGAMRLGADPPSAPFVARTGPEVPYVLPRLLENDDIRAVVSSLSVGTLPAYLIVYYAQPIPRYLPRCNTWGMDRYTFRGPDGMWLWADHYDDEDDLDFDLQPWIAQGKLQWIAPGDTSFNLRHDADDCPYLGLDGRRELLMVRRGRVWSSRDAGSVVTNDPQGAETRIVVDTNLLMRADDEIAAASGIDPHSREALRAGSPAATHDMAALSAALQQHDDALSRLRDALITNPRGDDPWHVLSQSMREYVEKKLTDPLPPAWWWEEEVNRGRATGESQ